MTIKIPNATLRRVRDMLRAGTTHAEVRIKCHVPLLAVRMQARLLRVFEGYQNKQSGYHEDRVRGQALSKGVRGAEYDENQIDLVDIFNTPRTPRQLRRFHFGDI